LPLSVSSPGIFVNCFRTCLFRFVGPVFTSRHMRLLKTAGTAVAARGDRSLWPEFWRIPAAVRGSEDEAASLASARFTENTLAGLLQRERRIRSRERSSA